MTDAGSSPATPIARRAPVEALDRFCREALAAAGADEATVKAVTRAVMHGSRHGVDSHGVRLLDHYVTVLMGGRVNPRPNVRIVDIFGAVASLDADHGHGALAAYTAMDHAIRVAEDVGICAVAIRNSSHFGPAGAFALAAAEAGFIGIVVCNADDIVRLHDGAIPFHGTNPIACGVPVGEGRPWLLDMATSAIPYNRVLLNRSLGVELPEGVASSGGGEDTQDPHVATMLAPLGGAFGYKGAGLAGLIEILSALLTGMKLSFEMDQMAGPDYSKPRELGAFLIAIRPEGFIELPKFHDGMRRYLETLRNSPGRAGSKVMAPGDREWAEAEKRDKEGVPLDPATCEAFERLAQKFGLDLPFAEQKNE